MEEKTVRAMPGQTVLGALLLVTSGALLAVDIGVSGTTRAVDRSLPSAEFAPQNIMHITVVTTPPAPRITSLCNVCDASHSGIQAKAAPHVALAPSVAAATLDPRCSARPASRDHRRSARTPNPGAATQPLGAPTLASKGEPSVFASYLPSVQAWQQLATHALPRTISVALAPHHAAPLAPKKPSRTAVEGAQYFVVQMLKSQIRGLRSISAITRKKGRDRLVVRVIAHLPAATLLECDIVRRNGIGFVLETRKDRIVETSAPVRVAHK